MIYQSSFKQWFRKAMIPLGYNYLPLEKDMSNIISQIIWSRNNHKKAEEIIANQYKTAQTCFTSEEIQNQFVFTLKEYSKKFNYKIKTPLSNKFTISNTVEEIAKSAIYLK